MRELRIIILYFIGCIVIGSAIAPWLFFAVQPLVPVAEARGWLRYEGEERDPKGPLGFLGAEFEKFANRGLLIAAIALLWPTFRALRMGDIGALGLQKNRSRWRHLAVGFVLTAGTMWLLGFVLLSQKVYWFKQKLPWSALGGILLSALVVAALEEAVFRGAFMGMFRRSMSRIRALAAVSALYSIVHFLKPPDSLIARDAVNWASGFALLPERFSEFANPVLLLAKFGTLFLVGWIIGWAALRTQSLWLPIGLHAGWVFGKFGFSKLTKRSKQDLLPWVGSDLIVGLVPMLLVGLVGVALWVWLRRKPQVVE
jgi:membrane protease YdiL (CAAX protease family)